MVLYHAAAYLEKSFVLAFPHLLQASSTALNAYPIAKSPDEALEKGKDWQGVFGESPNGAFETMRTTVNLLATLRGLVNDTANPDILVKMLGARVDIDQVRSQILQILLDAMKDDSAQHRALLLTAGKRILNLGPKFYEIWLRLLVQISRSACSSGTKNFASAPIRLMSLA